MQHHCKTKSGEERQDDADVEVADNSEVDVSLTGHITFRWNDVGYKDAVVVSSVPVSQSQCYFEIEIFALHDGSDVTIALVPHRYQHNSRHCTAPVYYRASDGFCCCGEDTAARIPGERCSVSDKIGCGIEFTGNTRHTVYFTRNSSTVQEHDCEDVPEGDLYPAVILRSSAHNTVCVCVQDADNWKFSSTSRCVRPSRQGAHSSSDIVINADSCTASLKPGSDGVVRNATMVSSVPFSADVSYFEIEILSGNAVAVGAVMSGFPCQKLPGWETESIGYHSDSGGLFIEDDNAKMFVQQLQMGDSMGCGISGNDKNSRKVYFTRNGLTVTEICFGDDMKALYPAVGLQSVTDETSVFIADLSSSKLWQEKNTLHQTVRAQAGVDSQLAADTPVVTSDMMEKINKELQCPICWNRLVQPKLLPCCQHTFCLDCISSYIEGCTNGQTSCPVCRTSFRLPRRGATALENNNIANRLLEITKTH